MALGITAGVVGAGMVAGGTAAAIKANRVKTKPKKTNYGGSAEGTDAYLDQYAQGQQEGATMRTQGLGGMDNMATKGAALADRGADIRDGALSRNVTADRRAEHAIGKYDPSAAIRNESWAALDQSAKLNLAGAGDSPLQRRAALNANAEAGVQAAQDRSVAVANAMKDKQLLLAQEYGNQEAMKADQRRLNLSEAQFGQTLVEPGMSYEQAANTARVGTGMELESQYLGATQHVEDAQLQADLDYERRRQQEAQRKSQNYWDLGSSLIGGGARTASAGFGGGK